MNGASALIHLDAFMVYRRAILPFFYFADLLQVTWNNLDLDNSVVRV
jgi:hypothetical protein